MKKILYAAASVPMIAFAAHAQEGEAEQRRATIIVTGVGPDRSADELIGNATALDRDQILDRLSASLGDTLDREPGVASSFFGAGASRPVLRGLGAERVQVLTNGIGVIDVSAASPDHQVTADGIDADKIEILRGPAALAYGGQAIGGVVNVIDGLIAEELPEEAASGDAFAAYNTVSEGTELGGRVKFATGPLVAAFTASQRDFNSYEIPGFARSAQLRAAEPATGPEVEGTQQNSAVDTQTLAGGASLIGDAGFFGVAIRNQTATYGLPAEDGPFIDLDQTRYDVRGGLNVDNGFLTQILGTLAIADYEHTEFEEAGVPGTVFTTEGIEGRIEAGHTISGFEGAFGLQYLDKEFVAIGDEAFITPTDTKSLGVFIYETREWESGFGVEGGLRFDSVEVENISGATADFDLVSASFGAHRHFENGWFAGALVAYTERAPNESELFADGPHLATEQYEVGSTSNGKESGLNLEGSVRWTGDTLSFGANLFVTSFSDFIYLTPGLTLDENGVLVNELDDLPVFLFLQDDATFAGGEIYANAVLNDGPLGADWVFDASLDLVNAELDGGGNVPLVPPVTLNGGAKAKWGPFGLGANLTLAGDQDDPGAGQLPTEGYTHMDFSADYDLTASGFGREGTRLFVEVRNATDEDIRYATSVLKDVVPLPGRNVRAGIKVSF